MLANPTTINISDTPDAERREYHLRLGLAWVLCYALFQLLAGAAWDGQFHAVVGRDTFYTTPHLLLYSSTIIAGLVCLLFVLVETIRYHRHAPAVTAANTSRIFGLFHAPMGFVIAGFGMLTMIVSAPLDDYWHQLYGLDAKMWAPFHMMGWSGMVILGVGTSYIFATLSNVTASPIPRIGQIVSGVALLGILAIVVEPTVLDTPLLRLAGLDLALYPILAAPVALFVLVMVRRSVGWRWAGTATGLLFAVFSVAYSIGAVALMDWTVQAEGLTPRTAAPNFAVTTIAYPTLLFCTGLAVDGLYQLATARGWSGGRLALIIGIIGSSVYVLTEQGWLSHVSVPSDSITVPILVSLPLAWLVGSVAAAVGDYWGRVLAVSHD